MKISRTYLLVFLLGLALLHPMIAAAAEGSIFSAIKDGDSSTVAELLKDNPGLVTSKDADGFMPLHRAALKGSKAIVALLLANKADINAMDEGYNHRTPLQCALYNGNMDLATFLVENKADVNAVHKGGVTALGEAISQKQFDMVKFLVAHGADVNLFSEFESPLMLACREDNVGMAKLFLESKADVNPENTKLGGTPLSYAVRGRSKTLVELLLAKGALIDNKPGGITTLNLAAMWSSKDVVELLLAKGADINFNSGRYGTALHGAAEKGNQEVVKLLLAKEADVNARDDDGKTPLVYAISGKTVEAVEVVKLLLAKGANVNARDDDGKTPLLYAIWEDGVGVDEVVTLLLAKGANVKARDDEGRTALDYAILNNRDAVVKMIRDAGGSEGEKKANNEAVSMVADDRGWSMVNLAASFSANGSLEATNIETRVVWRVQCLKNLWEIQVMKEQWALEENKDASAIPTVRVLSSLFGNGKVPKCPAGGIYTLNAVGVLPTCSIAEHKKSTNEEEIQWYLKAAEQGSVTAQLRLFDLYRDSSSTNADPQKAFEWAHKAANQGSGKGQLLLAFCYYEGTGVQKNPQKAAELFRKSAGQGNKIESKGAQLMMGCLYEVGDGVIKDSVTALAWYYLAKAGVDQDSILYDRLVERINELEKALSPELRINAEEKAKKLLVLP